MMLAVVVAVAGGAAPCPSLPLAAGTAWTYRADVSWTGVGPGTQRDTTITWTTEVLTEAIRDSVRVATVENWPSALAWWEPGRPPDTSLIACRAGRAYRLRSHTTGLVDSLLSGRYRPTDDDLLFRFPLHVGDLYGRATDARSDTFYAWYVESAAPVDAALRSLGASATDSLYALAYRTLPDHQLVGFVPGLGVAQYAYGHHGTVATASAALVSVTWPSQNANEALGTVHFVISCSPPAQAEFDRAVALLHHMTYPQAREAFERVAAIDARCAMAHWGIAMTLFQPLWPTRPGPAERSRGWQAVQTAMALRPPTDRERSFVSAADAFFREPASADYWLRIRRWEAAAAQTSAAFPDDDEAAAFYALAHLATAPQDSISRAHSDRAAAVLLRVYERHPDHPGAMHYLIHANDVPGRERELLEITRKYETVAPHNPHALHMPTHIYTRLGDWEGVIRGNLRAADAALAYPAGAHGEFVWDEFPHALEYLVYAYLQQGADDSANRQLQRMQALPNLEPTFKTAFHLASTGARYALERRAWAEAARLVPREPATLDWDHFTWPEAITQFARGLGAVHLGDTNGARVAVERLARLEAGTGATGEALFARNIRVLHLELEAWLAHVTGGTDTSVALMRDAARLESATPKHAVTPGPTLPADELLGDLLLEQQRPADALAAYQRSLAAYPRRFNSLLGLARAARAAGDASLARRSYEELLAVGTGAGRGSVLAEARAYVNQRR